MRKLIVLSIMVSCCFLHGLKSYADGARSRQYAYIGGNYGIYEFRIKADGSLQPLRNGPVQGRTGKEGRFLGTLLIDPQAHAVYGLSMDNKIYTYAIGRTGRLSLKATAPWAAGFDDKDAVLDPQQHFLYAIGNDNSLLVYDALHPAHLIKRQSIKANADLGYLVLDQERHSLLAFGEHHVPKQAATGVLLRYPLRRRGKAATSRPTVYSINSPDVVDALVGPFLVGSSDAALTVQTVGNGSLRPVSRRPLLKSVAESWISRIAYRRAGSFLYVGTYESTGDPHITASPSPLVVCRLSSDGHLSAQEQTGRPVPNPLPFLDNTGRFLYVMSMEGPVDAYRVGPNGRLVHSGSPLTIPAPAGMVFFGGRGK